jgi:hypothetical protein
MTKNLKGFQWQEPKMDCNQFEKAEPFVTPIKPMSVARSESHTVTPFRAT